MCLGGHLAFRAAFDKRVKAAVCYFATDIHSHTLGAGKNDDSLQRVKEITGELVMVSLRGLRRSSGDATSSGIVELTRSLDFREERHSRPAPGPRSHSQDTARRGSGLQLLRAGVGAACLHPGRALQGAVRPGTFGHLLPDAT